MEAPPPVAAPSLVYAGFWKRFVAVIIDGILLYVVNTVITLAFFGSSMASLTKMRENDPAAAVAMASGAGMIWLISIAIGWLYGAFMESSANQGTLGKMALGLRVTDLDGNRISFARATGRYFGKFVSAIILCIGYIMAGFTAKKQALHDMMAGTLVLGKSSLVPQNVAANAYRSQTTVV
jgi:uncharacterized RDD family membrane protein YckC